MAGGVHICGCLIIEITINHVTPFANSNYLVSAENEKGRSRSPLFYLFQLTHLLFSNSSYLYVCLKWVCIGLNKLYSYFIITRWFLRLYVCMYIWARVCCICYRPLQPKVITNVWLKLRSVWLDCNQPFTISLLIYFSMFTIIISKAISQLKGKWDHMRFQSVFSAVVYVSKLFRVVEPN